jgi:hypothetical protein
MRIEDIVGDLGRGSVADFRIPYHVQSKAPKIAAQMAPGIHVPVRPIVNQTLW